jgi:magnesium transporter
MLQKSSSFFFSKILNKDIFAVPDSEFGKLNDVVLDFSGPKPVVNAIQVRNGRRMTYVSAEFLEIWHDGREHYEVRLNTDHLKMMTPPENGFFLAHNFLDKQIVDIHGRKVERVNDVRLGMVAGKWTVIAVDIGMRGLLRRMGMEYPAIHLSGIMNRQFHNKLIFWNDVQPITSGIPNLQLSTSMNKLTTLHAADIADIVEDLDKEAQMTVLHGLGDEKAAEVLEEMEDDKQQEIIKTLPDERASDLLELMSSDEAADILEDVDDRRAKKLLDQMETENSSEIRELMEYEDAEVGSVMTKDFVSFLPDSTVEEALKTLKEREPEEETSHYIFLTDEEEHLTGMTTLLDMAFTDRSTPLKNIMTNRFYKVRDEDHLDKIMDLMQKYNLQTLPVVNDENQLVGIIFLNDLIHEYVKLRRISV